MPLATFSKPLAFLTDTLDVPMLPPFAALVKTSVAHHEPAVLELGCGESRALIEAANMLAEASNSPPCAACINSASYNALRAPPRGSVVGGNVSREALQVVADKYRLPLPLRTPQIVHGNFLRGVPWRDRAFDLVLSQHALNVAVPCL